MVVDVECVFGVVLYVVVVFVLVEVFVVDEVCCDFFVRCVLIVVVWGNDFDLVIEVFVFLVLN